MKRLFSIIAGLAVILSTFSCNTASRPKEGKQYIQIDKGLTLPVPNPKDSTRFDYKKVKVTFEADGVYLRTKEILGNAMMSVLFTTPQYKTILGNKEYRTNIGLEFKDFVDGWNIYHAPYSDFKKYTPYWTWDDVEAIRFLYEPESFENESLNPMNYENAEDFLEALQKVGFTYDVTIYGNCTDNPALNDPDFNDVFKLFRAHTQ